MYEKFPRTEWFRHDRFGMFIHFGLYTIRGDHEWARGTDELSDELYNSYFNQFNPDPDCPRAWAKLAKRAGMKYVVLTAKHHEGFCNFDSAYTDFKITNTPYGKDLIRQYVDALHEEGLKVGIYYSLIDWNHPSYPAYHHQVHPHRNDESIKDEKRDFSKYIEYMHNQVRELCTNYGKIDIMWFDFSYDDMTGEKWEATKLVRMVRELQPGIILDNRLETGGNFNCSLMTDNPLEYAGDFLSPELLLPPNGILNNAGEPVPWEACMTVNDHWCFSTRDFNYKNESIIIHMLLDCVSKNGNLLLDVGPDARGRIPKEAVEILEKVGDWMDGNGDAVYGCGKSRYAKPDWGRYTQCGKTVYACINEIPCGPLPLYGIKKEDIDYIRILPYNTEINLYNDWRTENYKDIVFVNLINFRLYNNISTVLKIVLK